MLRQNIDVYVKILMSTRKNQCLRENKNIYAKIKISTEEFEYLWEK